MLRGELADRAQRLVDQRMPFVLATVVRARRPASVRPGYCAVVLADGTIEGFVGGACAESSVRLYSLRALETGEPVLLRLVPGDHDDAAGGLPQTADSVGEAVVERNPCLSGGALEIFLEPHVPSARMLIVGSSPIATALERVAVAAGHDVARTAEDGAHPSSEDSAVIVASHGSDEERVLAEALTAGVPYVALVASGVRGAALRSELDVPDPLRMQLHTPAGLDIGARTPEEIAISILAEVVAERHTHPVTAAAALSAHPMAADAASSSRATVAIDPICGMEVAVTAASLALEVDGERMYFCGEHCRQKYAHRHAAR
jgi:xanthine dehydrogenase accessory factor